MLVVAPMCTEGGDLDKDNVIAAAAAVLMAIIDIDMDE